MSSAKNISKYWKSYNHQLSVLGPKFVAYKKSVWSNIAKPCSFHNPLFTSLFINIIGTFYWLNVLQDLIEAIWLFEKFNFDLLSLKQLSIVHEKVSDFFGIYADHQFFIGWYFAKILIWFINSFNVKWSTVSSNKQNHSYDAVNVILLIIEIYVYN